MLYIRGDLTEFNKMKLPKLQCNRCYHEWIPRTEKTPDRCPKCISPYWNKERIRPYIKKTKKQKKKECYFSCRNGYKKCPKCVSSEIEDLKNKGK